MDDGGEFVDAHCFQQSRCAEDVGVQRIDWRGEAGFWVALGGEVKDVVGTAFLDAGDEGFAVVEICVVEVDAVLLVDVRGEVLDVGERAAPADHAVDFPIRVGEEVVSEVGTHHAGESSD